jgi:hypothetical protein
MLLAEVGVYLAAQSASVPFNTTLTRGTNLWEGDLSPDPESGVALFEYPGEAPELDMGTELVRIEYPRFQVMVRHSTFATGRLLLEQIKRALIAVGNESLSGVRYLTIDALQSNPMQLPRDDNQAWRWTMNFQAMKEPSTT